MGKTSMFWILVLLAAALGVAALLFVSNLPKPVQIQPSQISPTPQPDAEVSTPANIAPQNDESEWRMITLENVDKACLAQAKKEAAAMGYNEAVVFGCGCIARESAETKSYSCKIFALDGEHSASISCSKGSRTCEIISEQGRAVYTFNQLKAMAS